MSTLSELVWCCVANWPVGHAVEHAEATRAPIYLMDDDEVQILCPGGSSDDRIGQGGSAHWPHVI